MAAAFFAALSKSACKLSGSPAHALASVNALENASLRRAASYANLGDSRMVDRVVVD